MELALNLTIIGIVVVFITLWALSILITLLSKFSNGGFRAEEITVPNENPAPAPAATLPVEEDRALIAVITGAIMAMLSKTRPGLKFKVKSLRRIDNNPNPWNRNK